MSDSNEKITAPRPTGAGLMGGGGRGGMRGAVEKPKGWDAIQRDPDKLEQHGLQGEGGDPAPLLSAGEASPGVLCPDVKSSVQERHGLVGAHSEDVPQN